MLIRDILTYARYEPQVLQIELHPYLTQDNLIKLANTLGIALTAYSSFGPQSYVELGVNKGVVGLLEHDTVGTLAKTYNRSESLNYDVLRPQHLICYASAPAQILLRWAVQQGIAVIPKSNNHERLVSNLNILDFSLSDAEMKQLTSLNINLRVPIPSFIVTDIHSDLKSQSSSTTQLTLTLALVSSLKHKAAVAVPIVLYPPLVDRGLSRISKEMTRLDLVGPD